jgi:hypothetical protein
MGGYSYDSGGWRKFYLRSSTVVFGKKMEKFKNQEEDRGSGEPILDRLKGTGGIGTSDQGITMARSKSITNGKGHRVFTV